MERKNLLIKDYEDKKGQTSGKRYTRFLTNEGWFSAFEKDVCEELKKLEGKWALCGVVETDKNKNIREFHGPGEEQSSEEATPEPTQGPTAETEEAKPGRLHSQRDCSIVAQCLTKCTARIMVTRENSDEKEWVGVRRAVLRSYRDFKTELESAQ